MSRLAIDSRSLGIRFLGLEIPRGTSFWMLSGNARSQAVAPTTMTTVAAQKARRSGHLLMRESRDVLRLPGRAVTRK